MSDFALDSFDDSFDSGAESDIDTGGQSEPLSEPLQCKSDIHLHVPFEIHRVKEIGHSPNLATFSDPDEGLTGSLQEGVSPKPKRKFKHTFKKPNLGKMTQKLKIKLKKDTPVFGVTLETAVQRSVIAMDGIELPTVFRECLDYLEETGIEQQGLYRLPGVKSTIEDAKSRFDKGDVIDLTDYEVNTIASLLKQYLRELPEPLLPPRLAAKFESITTLPYSQQYEALDELMEYVPSQEKLLLSWLITHMSHIIDRSSVNKMSLPNLVIVFSPTLQISAPVLHSLFNNRLELFGEIELKKYERPVVTGTDKKEGRVKVPSLSHVASLQTEEEITTELKRLTETLDGIHSKMSNRYDEKDDYMWELQRAITILRRKKKALQKKSKSGSKKPLLPPAMTVAPATDDQEFMKTLMLMQATLEAENEELMAKKKELEVNIRQESDVIDSYKRRLRNRRSHIVELSSSDDEDNMDESSLAQKQASLRWHNKELQLRNRNLTDSIQEEESVILGLKVKLKVLPFQQLLNLEEGTIIS